MGESKGCQTITAPPRKPGSLNEHREDQDPDPKAEGIGLVTSALDENSELKKRPTTPKRPKRPKTRPPDIPECRQVSLPSAATEQLITANASRCPNKEFRAGTKDEKTQTGDGGPDRSDRSERPERSESPKNLNASAYPNSRTGTVRTCSHPITKTISRRYQPYSWERGRLYNNIGDNQTMQRKKGCRGKKGARAQKSGMYLQMTRWVRERVC